MPALKNRLLAASAIALIAAAPFLWRMTGLQPSLEVVLNLVWLVLVLASFGAWGCRRPAPRPRHLELVTLVFVFALLFPVISPSDDLAQPLDDDACTSQLVISGLKAEKHTPAAVGLPESALPVLSFVPMLARSIEIAVPPAMRSFPAAIGHASGNHSPPLS